MNRMLFRHSARAAIVLLAVCAGAARGATAAPKQPHFPCEGEITTDRTNLRAGRSTNYETVYRLDRGARVMVTGLEKGWYLIEAPEDVPCYVSTRFLAEGKVVCGRLNVRAQPSPKATVICQLERGDVVEEIGRDAEWTTIKAPDCAELWVSAELVDLVDEEGEGERAAGDEDEGASPAASTPSASVAAGVKPAEMPRVMPVKTPPASVAAGAKPAEMPRVMPVKTPPETAPGPTGTPYRQEGKLLRAEEMDVRGAPYCLVQGFFLNPSVVCLLDSSTLNLSHYLGDRVRIWGYELSRRPEGIPIVDVRRLEVE